jgi:hypothetical protein
MRLGYLSIEVLTFLNGQPWDDVARAFVHALRPSEVRVSTGELKSDAKLWRVTVMVDRESRIIGIDQEVEVVLPDGFPHGHALACELDLRRRSK